MPVRKLRSNERRVGRPPGQSVRPLQQSDLPGPIKPSRTGLIPEQTRQEISDIVQGESVLGRFFLQATPAAIGTFVGGAIGSAFAGVGVVPGAMMGGFFGEIIGQELGMTPQSDIGAVFAFAGPGAGRLAAPMGQAIARGTGKSVTSIAPAKAAIARKAVKDSVDELSSFGARVLSKQKGIMRVPASKIYNTVRGLGVQIDPRQSFTVKALGSLERELVKMSRGFPEVAQALRTVRGVKEILSRESISFSEIISTKQLIGAAVRKARRATGIKLRTPKAIFKAMADDIDALVARGKGLKGTGAKLLKKADARAKLEFSVAEFEEGLAENLKFIPEEGTVVLNVSGFRNWLGRITNPRHKQYNKNFTEALKDELPDIRKRLAEIDKISKTLSPGGPGSLIIRGAGAGAGGAAGFAIGGEIGAAIGVLAGASMPEMITAVLLSKPGAAFLTRAATMGRGAVNEQAWALLGQILAQGIKPGEPQGEPIPFRSTVPIQ